MLCAELPDRLCLSDEPRVVDVDVAHTTVRSLVHPATVAFDPGHVAERGLAGKSLDGDGTGILQSGFCIDGKNHRFAGQTLQGRTRCFCRVNGHSVHREKVIAFTNVKAGFCQRRTHDARPRPTVEDSLDAIRTTLESKVDPEQSHPAMRRFLRVATAAVTVPRGTAPDPGVPQSFPPAQADG